MYFVYELVDPRNNVTGYIGITNNPNQRYLEHIEGRVKKGKKYEWIKRLQKEGLQPKMRILEVVDDLEQARRQEQYWIQQYLNEGILLVNTLLIGPTAKDERQISRNIGKRISEEEKRISKVRPPQGYITAKEASSRLNVSEGMIRHHVQKGEIEYLHLPGMRHGFYLERDVDNLVNKMNAFYALAEKFAEDCHE